MNKQIFYIIGWCILSIINLASCSNTKNYEEPLAGSSNLFKTCQITADGDTLYGVKNQDKIELITCEYADIQLFDKYILASSEKIENSSNELHSYHFTKIFDLNGDDLYTDISYIHGDLCYTNNPQEFIIYFKVPDAYRFYIAKNNYLSPSFAAITASLKYIYLSLDGKKYAIAHNNGKIFTDYQFEKVYEVYDEFAKRIYLVACSDSEVNEYSQQIVYHYFGKQAYLIPQSNFRAFAQEAGIIGNDYPFIFQLSIKKFFPYIAPLPPRY